MKVTIFAGKGGVGKSTSAAAFAMNKAKHGKVLVVDYDGGHSLSRVFSLPESPEANRMVSTGIPYITLAVIDPLKYRDISISQKCGHDFDMYMQQFTGDYGLVPFCDMVTSFFGVPTDTSSVSRFASLTEAYYTAKETDIEYMIVDVEPTAGLERLLGSAEQIASSIKNLNQFGVMRLTALGAFWPDIRAYLQSSYIKDANRFSARLTDTSDAMKTADYFIVSIPESSPVEEMGDVGSVISSYGGSISGYVINNIRGEPHESSQIRRVYEIADDLPVFEVEHDHRLCHDDPHMKLQALRDVGNIFETYTISDKKSI